MSEERYNVEHLQDYIGILTSHDIHHEKFTMELKAEDNPVMERWAAKNESSIELEFSYYSGTSTAFYHNRNLCPLRDTNKCPECKDITDRHYKFEANLERLQVGDTFRITAALMNNNRSVLPAEIHNFENYQPLVAACTEYWLRLDDTPEGINKKYEREQQRMQREREAEKKRTEDEEQAQKDARGRKRKERFQQFFGESPIITTIIATAIGSVIAGIILATIFNPIPRLFKYLYNLIFSN